jgi:IS30 family transposase
VTRGRQIGAALGRSHTTVSREVKLNGGRERYRALNADRAAWRRARRPQPAKLATRAALRAVVEEKLELRSDRPSSAAACATNSDTVRPRA